MATLPAPAFEVQGPSISQIRRRAAEWGFRFQKIRNRPSSISEPLNPTYQLFRFQRKRIKHHHRNLTVVERAIIRNVFSGDVLALCNQLDRTMQQWEVR